MRRWLLLTLSLSLAGPALARRGPEPEVQVDEDPLALVALLIRDGHWDRAAAVLESLTDDAEGLDVPRHRGLQGLVRLRLGRPDDAIAGLEEAQALGSEEPLLGLYLAQGYLDAGRFADAYAAGASAGPAAEALPAGWMLRAAAAQKAGLSEAAWDALIEGGQRFPDRADDFGLRQVLLMVDLGLHREAAARGRDLLAASVKPWKAVAEALRRAGEPSEAAGLLEEARLRFPEDEELPLRLAGALVEAGRPRAAGALLEAEAALRPELALEAAECYRRAGWIPRALSLNARVPDPAARYQQRLGLLIEGEDWGRATMLEPRLRRHELTNQDEVAYALGYAWFRVGDGERATALLRGIADPAAFERATKLREAIARCDEDPLGCL